MLIIAEKDKAIRPIEVLRPSAAQVIVYSDGSRIEDKGTAAAAWCENSQHYLQKQLGQSTEYGIFEAEFVGFIQALTLAKNSFELTARQLTIILDNQGFVKDMSTKQTSSRALPHKLHATKIIKEIKEQRPRLKITLRWCPGHKGVPGNEKADALATSAANRPL